ncbi:MAG: tRNA (adenosine(37)-N6)-threonylcarbamoyltransferase complex transferase subunit TsaD [bacterium]|nr:tRNA (adenosine(37)-N6)-threonylcarbamoyltransferase complex transferase subunit TsaD [bacterium]
MLRVCVARAQVAGQAKHMIILSIDTSCDETACSVTDNTRVLSNIVWSQASLHAKFGGVVPSLAQRKHKENIDWVVEKAIKNSKYSVGFAGKIKKIDCIAVTIGPGLSIALGVGINKAKQLAQEHNKPLIAVNHLEAHLLSPIANPKFPALGLVISGGNTMLVKIGKIGSYKTLAQTRDDALGEALDKAARMLGLGYPGGAILEKFAKEGNPNKYDLPIPMLGRESLGYFSYSGLKTSFYRLVEKEKPLNKIKIYNLAASFQNTAFNHLTRIIAGSIRTSNIKYQDLLVGGGVAANAEVRKRIRKMARDLGFKVWFPYSKKLCGDNAAMIGICAYLNSKNRKKYVNIKSIDRAPGLKW